MTLETSNRSASGFFNKNASASYDERQRRLAPIVDNLHFLIGLTLQNLPQDASILCVGVGTGGEIIKLAEAHLGWRFTGIDPSSDMLDVCRTQLENRGLSGRVKLFHGYLSDYAASDTFDAVLCLLVTQFVKDHDQRQGLFNAMAQRLKPHAYLINAELSADMASPEFSDLLEKWKVMQMLAGSTLEQVENILPVWKDHVSIVPPLVIENFLRNSGFSTPVQFYQSFLIHAWYSRKD